MEAIKFYEDYDDEISVVKQLEEYLKENGSYENEGLIIGYWNEAYDSTPTDIIDYLVENKLKFPNLKSIFLGDMDGEECEVSWINHADTASLLNNFNLEELTVKGSTGLRFINAKSETLKKLTIICGGLDKDTLKDISLAKLTNLEHLELYIGVDNYGFNGDISDLEVFMERDNFPKLKYLGLKNSEIQDEICKTVLNSNIIKGLESLDLSLGTLSDEGAEAILQNIDKLTHLIKIDLTYNYISDELIEKLEEAFKNKNTEIITSRDDVYFDDDDDYRYPYITE